MKTWTLILTALLAAFPGARAQTPPRCGSAGHLERMLSQDPGFRARLAEIERRTGEYLAAGAPMPETVVRIPVVFHVLHNSPAQNLSDAQVISQLAVLNEDFRRSNADAGSTPAQWQGIAADTEFEFCLAAVDPAGNPTSGITRRFTNTTLWPTNNAMMYTAFGGQDIWDRNRYLNIWVCNLDGLLGYAQFPGGPAESDGVVIDTEAFGRIGTAAAPYHLGRTVTHEVGHWLNLVHIWGDVSPPACGDDQVADTPMADQAHYGCQSGIQSCGGVNMIENYMDYTDDRCYNLFTQGQKARMQALFQPGGARNAILGSPAAASMGPCVIPQRALVANAPVFLFDTWTSARMQPALNAWNALAVSSSVDWDVFAGAAQSRLGGAACDFAVLNGWAGSLDYRDGVVQRYSGGVGGLVEHLVAAPITTGAPVARDFAGHVADLVEFPVSIPGAQSVTVTGTPNLRWSVYAGSPGDWQPRGGVVSGLADGQPRTFTASTGRHALMVYRDDGSSPGTAYSVTVCSAPVVALAQGAPSPVSAGCSAFSLTPVTGRWQAVGVTSPSDMVLTIGGATSSFAGSYCEFAIANGNLGTPGPSTGTVFRVSGTSPATLQHVLAATFSPGQVVDTALPAGHALAMHEFHVAAAGSYDVTVTGDPALFFDGYAPGAGPLWRPRGAMFWGAVGSPRQTVSLGTGWHCVVIIKDGGVAAAALPYTVNVCPASASINLTAGPLASGNPWTVSNPCQPFSVSPQAGQWNAAGVWSTSDWDIAIGSAESQYGGASVDFLVANGHQGTIAPTAGLIARYSGADAAQAHSSPANLLLVGQTAGGQFPGGWFPYSLHEFEIAAPGLYDLTTGGAGGIGWAVFAPGAGAGWRTRSQAAFGGAMIPATLAAASLGAGWHALVVFRDGPASSSLPIPDWSFRVAPTPLNPAPAVSSLAPSSAVAGGPAFTLTVIGTGFVAGSEVRWNGAALATTPGSPQQLTAVVSAGLLASAGTAQVTVFNPGPGGGSSNAAPFTIGNPAPGAIAVVPAYAVAGSTATTVLVNGSGFVPGAAALWEGASLSTAFVSSGQLSATIPAGLLQASGTYQVTVMNPVPGGGTSPVAPFQVVFPIVTHVTPAGIPVMTPVSAPVTLSVFGNFFLPVSVVHANGRPLSTTCVSAGEVRCPIGPSILQALRPGGICINVQNTVAGFSNSGVLVVGGGANRGNLYLQPLAPAPGQPFAVTLESAAPGALYSLFADLGNPPPVTAWPAPAADLVLAVGPLTGSLGPLFAVVDGIGLAGPAQGAVLNAGGHVTLPGFVQPSPPLNIPLTVQALYLDATSPVGFRLSWARYPLDL